MMWRPWFILEFLLAPFVDILETLKKLLTLKWPMFSEIFKNFLIHSFCSANISDSENALFTFLRLITVKSKTNLEKQKLTLDNWGY